jgi:transmembrane protein 132
MAEKLVESAAQQQKNAFQFDSLPPQSKKEEKDRKNESNAMLDSGIGLSQQTTTPDGASSDREEAAKTLDSSSDDNGGFVTPPEQKGAMSSRSQVKRATVVGNPMFSNSPDSELGPVESLGLDDLDMDYEQIMNYFDNLKV